MKIHRFYYTGAVGEQKLAVTEAGLVAQWSRVLRLKQGQVIDLFNDSIDSRYRIVDITKGAVFLEYISDNFRELPKRNVYLLWSLLKKDKNEWVMQKCTELGVTHLVPIIADRSEKTGFNRDRARKITTEAAEQCGRSDIPQLHEAVTVREAVNMYGDSVALCIGEQYSQDSQKATIQFRKSGVGVFVGPEGGWSDDEKEFFDEAKLPKIACSSFTLRAETACVVLAAKLVQ